MVVGADDPQVGERIAALYRAFGGSELITDVTSAEMIKHASNAFLATKISFINEIANVCEEVGANVDLVARGMGLDAQDRRELPAARASASAARASRRTWPRSSSWRATAATTSSC